MQLNAELRRLNSLMFIFYHLSFPSLQVMYYDEFRLIHVTFLRPVPFGFGSRDFIAGVELIVTISNTLHDAATSPKRF